MAVTAAIAARLEAEVSVLAGRVTGAADLSRHMASSSWPTATPAAFVLFGGLTAGAALDATGGHLQLMERLVTVVLTVRGQDATGAGALDRIEELVDEIVAALAGWSPVERGWDLSVRRAQLASAVGGVFVFEITFALPDQLRIAA